MGISEGSEYSDVVGETYVSGSVSVSTTEAEAKVGGSTLSKREMLYIENLGNAKIFYGPTGFSTASAASLSKDQFVFIPAGEGIKVFLKTASGTATAVVQEWA